jgi:hypothetical protein
MFQKVMDKWFHVAWHMKPWSCLYNKFRAAALHFKKDMMQLFWIMKEFNQSTKKISVAFPKKKYYPND